MPENKNQLVYGLLLLGLILVGISTYYSFFTPKPTIKEIRLGRAEHQTGQTFVLRSGYTQKEAVLRKADLYNLDSVETMETGESIIGFESAFRVRLFNNTLVTLEKIEDQQDFHIVLIIKRGEVKVENFGRDGELFIAKNGERISASDYNGSSLSQMAVEPIQPTADFSTAAPANQGLAEEEINTVMTNHRTSFFKCYTQLLQKEPTAKGDVALSFTIENNGKLSVAEVTASQLNNEEFKKCLLEVLKRVEFRAFQGPPISTLFPLKFE
jgi:hypothetical protein